MAADNNVLHLERFNSKLYDRKTIQVSMNNNIGDIAMNKDFARWQVYDLIGWDATICATNSKVFRGLLLGQLGEKCRVFFCDSCCPGQISLKKMC